MILVGMLESPYVRRVAISAQCLGVEYKHRPLSVFNDYYCREMSVNTYLR